MKSNLPEIITRVSSPAKLEIHSSKTSSFSSKKLRHLTHSPSPKYSNDSLINIRTVSDELKSTKSSQYSIFTKLNPILQDLDKSNLKQSLHPRLIKTKLKLHSDVIKAILKMTNSHSEISSSSLINLFISLGYSSDSDSLLFLFRSMRTSDFSKNDLTTLMQDTKIDKILRVLLKEYKDAALQNLQEFDSFVQIIKKWWTKLDLSKNGFVSTEEVCRLLVEMNSFENSAEVRKSFNKFPPFMNFLQFFGIFSKGLLKFLLLSLCDDANSRDGISLDIALNARRRRLILSGIIGENKVLETLHHYNSNK